ncbi:MAG: M3 family oligoendopeptidase [Bacteroidetes bacterium]|nr:M3 family oligoendopeptidase [Bacteroidota bacterium]
MSEHLEAVVKENRSFVDRDFSIKTWKDIDPYYKRLRVDSFTSLSEFLKWLLQKSELESVLQEDFAWRYIKNSLDTANEEHKKKYEFFVSKIQPKLVEEANKLDHIILDSSFIDELDEEAYQIYFAKIRNQVKLFRKENIKLTTEETLKEQEYASVIGSMNVEIDGEEMPLPIAYTKLLDQNRDKRKEAFDKISAVRLEKAEQLNDLFNDLISLRNKIAENAGYDNYRDYIFVSLNRFDYDVQDCMDFHNSIKEEVLPLLESLMEFRKSTLGLDKLKPWDLDVDLFGSDPLHPFEKGGELADKSIQCLEKVDPFFGECVTKMKEFGRLDLDSRKGKAPGGYNYPLHETGIPFIFMNAAGTHKDVITMLHESGHAVHSFLNMDLELVAFKNLPAEVAELASMSMELISMSNWDVFYDSEDDLRKAKFQQLERIIFILPWVAIVDRFQHWIYENPDHDVQARDEKWLEILNEWSSKLIDWSGYEQLQASLWHKQLHIFELPFYYIEYGIAQLGAIGIWKQYKENPLQCVENYKAALSLGYTKSIPKVYERAGIQFNFSKEYLHELFSFVQTELDQLKG